MKFSMAVKKHNRATVGMVSGHNTRLHPTRSQLPKAAWFIPDGMQEVATWRENVLDRAKNIAQRKDAVLAIELILQVGNQSDWRELPTTEHPAGKPKAHALATIQAVTSVMAKAAEGVFGAENIIGLSLHADESSPHWHLVAAPIFKGKLQAKQWLDGPVRLAQLREKIHKVISEVVPCTYERGAGKGGALHNPGLAAGAQPVMRGGILGKLQGAVSNVIELEAAKKRIKDLEEANTRAFNRSKKNVERALAETKCAYLSRDIAREKAEAAEARATLAEGRLKALMYDPEHLEEPSSRLFEAIVKTPGAR